MYCKSCGTPLEDGQTVCPNCGTVNQPEQQPAQHPYQQPAQPQVYQPYQQPAQPQAPAAPQKNSLAVSGMVLGIIAIVMAILGWAVIGLFVFVADTLGIIGIILSAIGLAKAKALGKKPFAIVGLILSILAVVLAFAGVIVLFAAAAIALS